MRVLFFGSPPFAAKILEDLLDHGITPVGVVTQPDRPAGRSMALKEPAVKQLAKLRVPHLPLFQPVKASAPESVEALQMLKPDLFVVVAYGQILRPNLLAVPKLGSINVHASLLPRYRGAAPIQRCLMSGETETGISIIALAPEMDAGDVALMESCPIGPDTNFGELEEQLCQLGKKCLRKVMGQIEAGTACFTPQDATQATFAAKLRAENCQIRWTESAQTLHNLVRGLSPRPGAWCTLRIEDQVVRLKILRSRPTAGQGRPGQILERTDTLRIACGSDALELLELQSEGRRPMEVASWLRGMGETKMQFHD